MGDEASKQAFLVGQLLLLQEPAMVLIERLLQLNGSWPKNSQRPQPVITARYRTTVRV
jgi:hypothetical protein